MAGKAKKVILWLVVLLIAAPVLVVVVVLSRLGTLIEIGFETAGPRALHVTTDLEDASVYPLKGEVTLKGLAIGNPPGYKAPTLFQADRIHVVARPTALLGKEIHIREVTVDGPQMIIEFRDGKSNVEALLDRLDRDDKKDEGPSEPDHEGGARLKIDRIRITNVNVTVMMHGQPLKVPLAEVTIEGLGDEDGNGLPPGRIAKEIVNGIYRPIAEAIKLAEAAAKVGDAVRGKRGQEPFL